MNEFLKRFGQDRLDKIGIKHDYEPDAVAILQDQNGYELYFYTLQSVREFLSKPNHQNYKIIRP